MSRESGGSQARRIRGALAAAAALASIAFAFAFVFAVLPKLVIPSSEFQHPHVEASNRIQRQNELRGTAVQALAGLVLAFGALYTARNYKLSKDGQLTDRLRSAVDQVHTGGVAAIGGIVSLERLASDSERDRREVVELMATYVRMQAPLPSVAPPLTDRPILDSVLQTALTTIGRSFKKVSGTRALDLSASFLRGVDLRNAVLPAVYMERSDLASARLAEMSAEKADFSGANLTSVDATEIRLRGAKLDGAYLTDAIMSNADLRDAELRGAHISRVFLAGARLSRCDLSGARGEEVLFPQADLEGALISYVTLPKAFFVGAVLRQAVLHRARLVGAFLQQADLSQADLERADLRGADLRGADCSNANFCGADLRGALFSGAIQEGADLQDVIRDPGDPPLPATASQGVEDSGGKSLVSAPLDPDTRTWVRRVLRRLGVPLWRADEAYIETLRRSRRARRR